MKRYRIRTEPRLLAWLCMWESGNWCFRFVSWLIFSNLAFQTILIQYLMSDKTNPQIQILTIIQIKSKSSIFGYFQTSSPIKMYFGVKISQCRTSKSPWKKLKLAEIRSFRSKIKKNERSKDIDLESRFYFWRWFRIHFWKKNFGVFIFECVKLKKREICEFSNFWRFRTF